MTIVVLQLFVSGQTAISLRAIRNLTRICEDLLPGRHALTIIDVLKHPDAAERARVIATPTAIRLHPIPVRRLVGDMSNTARVQDSLAEPADLTGDERR